MTDSFQNDYQRHVHDFYAETDTSVIAINKEYKFADYLSEKLALSEVMLAKTKKTNAALVEALELAHTWFDRFGAHSPTIFGGEAEVCEKIEAALAAEKGEPK